MNRFVKNVNLFAVAVALLAASTLTIGATPADGVDGPVAQVTLGVNQVHWSPTGEFAGLRLTISGPDGVEQLEFAPGESPSFDLAAMSGVTDGLYSWELRATPKLDDETRKLLAEMRSDGSQIAKRQRPAGLPPADQLVQSGTFRVLDGAILQPNAEEPGTELRVQGAGADRVSGELGVVTGETVISGDLTVYNSLCVGFDCLSNETYGADTIRLKENNLRIHVEDTSGGSFPTSDWRLEFNSNLSGGLSYFRVIDASAGRSIMTLEANAPSHSLYVDSGGRVGMGTSNPVVELHVVEGDTPTLRLQQDTSSGFGAQVWDVAGNETSFFVRDATSGSTLPFRIFPGMPSGSLVLRDDNVGVGTTSPSVNLHVKDAAGTDGGADVLLKLENNGPPRFDQTDDSAGVTFRQTVGLAGATRFYRVIDIADGTVELELNGDGDLEIAGDLTANGTLYPSSRVFKENFSTIDGREVLERLTEVPVSLWNYKTDTEKHLHIGPVTEDFSKAFEFLQIDGKLNTIDLHGVAMAAIQGLNELVREKDARITELEQRLAALEAAMAPVPKSADTP